MKITYSRTGGETRTFDYDPDDLLNSEAKAIERVTGKTMEQVDLELQAGGMEARSAVLWMLMKRENDKLRYSDVEFRRSEVTVEFSRAERAETREKVVKATHLRDDQREAILAQLDAEDAEEEAAAAAEDKPAPRPAGPKEPKS